MIAVSRKERERYVPESERKKDAPAAFFLEPPTMRDRIEIEELVHERGGEVRPLGEVGYRLLRSSLRGWEGVTYEGGESVPFLFDPEGRPTDETLSALPAILRAEIALQVFVRMNLTEEDRKNFSSPQHSSQEK
jgi:hypothetical protein